MIKRLLLSIIALFFVQIASSQSYITKDTVCKINIKLVSGTENENAQFISMKKFVKKIYIVPIKNDTIYNSPELVNITYFPEDIDSYGLKDGRKYDSKEIEIKNIKKKVFLLRLVDGEVKLYFYSNSKREYFFIVKQNSGELILLNDIKTDKMLTYKEQLESVLKNCDVFDGVKRKVKYNQKSLTKLIQNYNRCNSTFFTYPKYGFTFGLIQSKYVPNVEYPSFLTSINNLKQNTFTFGVNADFPLKMGAFSLHPELYLMRNEIEYNQTKGNLEYNLDFSNFSINIPVMVRYSYETKKMIPYINVGIIYAYNLNNKQTYIVDDYSANVTNNKGDFIDLVANNRFGIVGGFGITFKGDNSSAIFAEFRYSSQGNLISDSMNGDYLSKKDIGIFVGINF